MLFAPGPVITSERVKKAALAPDLCHRSSDFENIYHSLRNGLLKLYKADIKRHTAVVVSGSGTAANEVVIPSVLKNGEKALLISNGEFGNRLKMMIECYKIGLQLVELSWGEYPDLDKIEDKLRKDKRIKLISVVFHETSTGMINPVHEIGKLARDYVKMYHVDAISAVGGEDVDVDRDNIDFCTGVPNKSVSGQPGISFVCVNRERIREIENYQKRNIYLNLQHHIKKAEDCDQTPNTPSVIMFLTLNEALEELFQEGLDNRIKRYKEDAIIIRKGLNDLNLELLLKEEKYMSNTITSAFLPEKIDIYKFIGRMYDEGYVVYPGKGPLLKKNMFQIANMGQIYPEDCMKFNDILRKVLAGM